MIILRGPYNEAERRIAERAYDSGFAQAEEESDGFTGVSGWTNRNPFRDKRKPGQAFEDELMEALTSDLRYAGKICIPEGIDNDNHQTHP